MLDARPTPALHPYRFYVSDGEGDTTTLVLLLAENDEKAFTAADTYVESRTDLRQVKQACFSNAAENDEDAEGPYCSVVRLETPEEWADAFGDLYDTAPIFIPRVNDLIGILGFAGVNEREVLRTQAEVIAPAIAYDHRRRTAGLL
jgi:hypothetical protein